MTSLNDPRPSLAASYDAAADQRELVEIAPWKVIERTNYLTRLKAEGVLSLLEVGAGTGVHGRWFADNGLSVTATDLSPTMVAHCRAKGLTAIEMDMQSLSFQKPFDAIFAMNCLLHIPNSQLSHVLELIAGSLREDGLGFIGQYGGRDEEGPWEGDTYRPKRFFSFRTDTGLRSALSRHFSILDFRSEDYGGEWRFQAATVRRL